MTDENAGAGAGRVGLWLLGAGAGLLVGVGIWAIALRETPVKPAEPVVTPAAPAPVAPQTAAPSRPAVSSGSAALPSPSPSPPEAAPAAMAPAAAAMAPGAPVAAAEPAPAAPAAPDRALPAFDTVRAEADGSVLIAGRAEPGAEVAVMADGSEVTRSTADDRGQFVAFADLGPSTAARVLTLRTGPETSAQSVILAPAEVATAMAEAPPNAAPASPAAEQPAAPVPAAQGAVPAAPEVLIADADGVRKLAPAAVEGVVIDTISYAANGDVMLAGRGQGLVRLYLDDALVAEARPDAGAWEVRLPDVAPGLYRLRADEIAADGKVASRFETPFQREAPEALAAVAAPPALAVPEVALPMPVLPAAPPSPEPATVAGQPATPVIALPALPQRPAAVVTEATVVTVQPGFTLWRIARENYGDGALYVKVFQANKGQIRNPDLIYPGQVFTVPDK